MEVTLTSDQIRALRQLARLHMYRESLLYAREHWLGQPLVDTLGQLVLIRDDMESYDHSLEAIDLKNPLHTLEIKQNRIDLFRKMLDEAFPELGVYTAFAETMAAIEPHREALKLAFSVKSFDASFNFGMPAPKFVQ